MEVVDDKGAWYAEVDDEVWYGVAGGPPGFSSSSISQNVSLVSPSSGLEDETGVESVEVDAEVEIIDEAEEVGHPLSTPGETGLHPLSHVNLPTML